MKYNEALDFFKKEYGVQIALRKIFRAMKEAKELVEGSEKEQYGRV